MLSWLFQLQKMNIGDVHWPTRRLIIIVKLASTNGLSSLLLLYIFFFTISHSCIFSFPIGQNIRSTTSHTLCSERPAVQKVHQLFLGKRLTSVLRCFLLIFSTPSLSLKKTRSSKQVLKWINTLKFLKILPRKLTHY